MIQKFIGNALTVGTSFICIENILNHRKIVFRIVKRLESNGSVLDEITSITIFKGSNNDLLAKVIN